MKKVLQREIKKINKNEKILNKNRFNNFCVKFNKNKIFDNSFKDEQNFLKKKNKTIFIEFNSNNSTINSTNNISFNNIVSVKNNSKKNFKKINNKKNNFSLSEKGTRNNIKKNSLKNNKNIFNKTTNFVVNNNNKINQKLNFNFNKKIKSKTPINLRNSNINLNTKKNSSQKNLNKMFFSTLPRALIDISKNDKISENINIKYNNDEIINFNLKLKNKNNIFNPEIINELNNLNFILNKIINTYKNCKNEEKKINLI